MTSAFDICFYNFALYKVQTKCLSHCSHDSFIWKISILTYTCQIFAWPMWSRSHDSCTWLLDLPNGTNWTNISYMSACQAYTRRGNGKTSLYFITKPAMSIPFCCVTFTDTRLKRADSTCTSGLFLQDVLNIRNWQMFVKYIGSGKMTQTSLMKV